MSKRRASQELETAFRQVLNNFLYNIREAQDFEILDTELHHQPPAGRHNYQRAISQANPSLHILYKGMKLCTVQRKPHTITIFKRSPETAPKGYFATKVLERVLFYDYPDVRLK